jgi:hypothetical protein
MAKLCTVSTELARLEAAAAVHRADDLAMASMLRVEAVADGLPFAKQLRT